MEKLKQFILSWEGGFVNDPRDSGGATNKGVTLATFRQVFGKSKTINDLKKITDDQWMAIFKKYYWDKWKADDIKSKQIAYLLVDWVWCSGKYGITKVQQYLKVDPDGLVGPKTIAALNALDPVKAFKDIWNCRYNYLVSISKGKNQVFLKGWLRRLNGIQYKFLKLNNGKIIYV